MSPNDLRPPDTFLLVGSFQFVVLLALIERSADGGHSFLVWGSFSSRLGGAVESASDTFPPLLRAKDPLSYLSTEIAFSQKKDLSLYKNFD